MELLSALFGLEQMEPFCSLPTGRFLLLPQRSVPALHRAASSRELPLLPLWILEPNPRFPPLTGSARCEPPGTRAAVGSGAELLHSSPQQFCLHPTAVARSPAAQAWPQEKAFHLVRKCLAGGFLFRGVPMPSPSISQAAAVQTVSERPQRMHQQQQLRVESRRLKRNFGNSSRHTLQKVPSPLCQPLFSHLFHGQKEFFK